MRRSYYKNGILQESATFSNDKLHGLTITYDENAKMIIEQTFKDGKLNGVTKSYDENEKLNIEILYKNDEIIQAVCGNGKLVSSKDFYKIKQADYSMCLE